MIDNEKIDERLDKQQRRRRLLVRVEIVLILIALGALLYAVLILRPAYRSGHPEEAIPPFLREYITQLQGNGKAEAEPTRIPTATPLPITTQTPKEEEEPEETPVPVPTVPPEIEALRLPSFGTADLSDWNLILVNQNNPIPDDYDLTLTNLDDNEAFSVDVRCAEAVNRMLRDCRDAGFSPMICSAYRDNDTQTYLFAEEEWNENEEDWYYEEEYRSDEEDWSEEGDWSEEEYWSDWEDWSEEGEGEADDGKDEDSAAVAAPGTSEHEIGLAVDIYSAENMVLDESQEQTETQQWLMRHCWEYGFILRYPKGKSDITGIVYEPWHYRFVGRPAAKDIYESGLTLEEYLENMARVKEADSKL